MKALTLIASYPKSGNTWARAFLASLAAGGEAVDINGALKGILTSAARVWCDQQLGVATCDLTPGDMARVRPWLARRLAEDGPATLKVHDANLAPPGGSEPPYPADVVDRAVFIVRDPRDVAVSNAHHFGKSLDQAVIDLNDADFGIGRSGRSPNTQVEQWKSDWSAHGESWLDETAFPVHLVRYEDLLTDPVSVFDGMVRFLGLEADGALIAKAADAVSFGRLAEQEARDGFIERHARADQPFFRKGEAGGWRDRLSPAQARLITDRHGRMMARLGYES